MHFVIVFMCENTKQNVILKQVQVRSGSKVIAQMSVNATTTSVYLHNVSTSGSQGVAVRVVAHTRVGPGPYSPAISLAEGLRSPAAHPSDNSSADTWFAFLLGATAVVLICAFAVTFYLKRRQAMHKELGHLTGKQ